MTFPLPALPFSKDALAPHISKETIEYHYGKHHQGYVNKLNELIADTAYAALSLEEIIRTASKGPLLNNAAQVWNHAFYWHCLSPTGGGAPDGLVSEKINLAFGSVDAFREAFTKAALQQFGSGWAWLVLNHEGQLLITSTGNAENPMTESSIPAMPLLTCDVWEHAYYIDTRNDRARYLEHFWKCVNWRFIEQNLLSPDVWRCYQDA